MIRKIRLFIICLLGLGSVSFGQNHASANIRTLVFPSSLNNSPQFAPSATAYLARNISQKIFYFGIFEYHKYSYLPNDFPGKRPGFLTGLGFENKNFSIRLGLGSGENLDYIQETSVRIGDNLLSKNYSWTAEGHLRFGQDNIQKQEEILAFGGASYKIYDLLEVGIAYSGKKTPNMSSANWFGPKIKSELETGLYLNLELLKGKSEFLGSMGIQIIFM